MPRVDVEIFGKGYSKMNHRTRSTKCPVDSKNRIRRVLWEVFRPCISGVIEVCGLATRLGSSN